MNIEDVSIKAGAAAVVGPLQDMPCVLGNDKIKRHMRWSGWHKEALYKMALMNMTDPGQKLSYVRSAAGPKLSEFLDTDARLRWTAVAAVGDQPERVAHTYDQVVEETSKFLLKLVNRDRAIIDLLRMEQGIRGFMEFLSDLEEQKHLTRQGGTITRNNLKRPSTARLRH